MKKTRISILTGFMLLSCSSFGAEWKPTSSSLMTRWAKQVDPAKVLPEYPRPQMSRKEWANLNGLWEFAEAQEGEQPPAWKKLSEQILVPFPMESALSGIGRQCERSWYRRNFSLTESWRERRILLHFGAVDWESKLWVNGKEVGTHRGGYDPFSFDITDALKKDSAEQEIVLGVYDPTSSASQPRGKQTKTPRGIFYTPCSGIWQTVWIEPVAPIGIADLRITPDIDKKTVTVAAELSKKAPNAVVEVIAKDGVKVVAQKKAPADTPIQLTLPQPKLWSPDNPHLYDLTVKLEVDGKTVDSVDSYFGMRKISLGMVDGVMRILLNNKFVFQVGPLDQGFWPDGIYTAPTDEALKFDIEFTKKIGMNMIRKHVKVEPARWYYWTDKLGVLVWQDMPSGDNKTEESQKQYEVELDRLVKTHWNYPSIIMWIVFNEGWGQFDTERFTRWVKDMDPTRLVNNASGWTDQAVGDVVDMHMYPGPGCPDVETTRAAVLGEFGGLGLPVEGHMWWDKNFSYQGSDNKEMLTRRYEQLFRRAYQLKDDPGLNAVVYTQTTDVEGEINGLITYDREVEKVIVNRVKDANQGRIRKVEMKVIVPTAQKQPVEWRYTLEEPKKDDWTMPEFDDSGWKKGPAGFGREGTPGAVVRTEWTTNAIWLRREVDIPAEAIPDLNFMIHHDERVYVYINGVRALRENEYLTNYQESGISGEARAAIKPGKNLIAVQVLNKEGGQYFDLGLVTIREK